MKLRYPYLTLLLCWLTLGSCLGQKTKKSFAYARLPLVEGKVVYTGVVPAGGIGPDVLFERGRQWLAHNIGGSPDTSRVRDPAAGRLVAHGRLTQPPLGAFRDPNAYDYTIAIYVKDGKYKYQIDQLRWTYSTLNIAGQTIAGPTTVPLEQLDTLPQNAYVDNRTEYVDSQLKGLIQSLAAAMTPGSQNQVTW